MSIAKMDGRSRVRLVKPRVIPVTIRDTPGVLVFGYFTVTGTVSFAWSILDGPRCSPKTLLVS